MGTEMSSRYAAETAFRPTSHGLSGPVAPGPPTAADQGRQDLDRALLADMRRVLDKAAAGLTRRGLTVTTRLDLAPPATSITHHCAEGFDLLVTGSRAYGRRAASCWAACRATSSITQPARCSWSPPHIGRPRRRRTGRCLRRRAGVSASLTRI
jgi:nucleotide-binding universal stress UspA family protein